MMKEKSQVMDIDRSIYDIKDVENDAYRIKSGLTPEKPTLRSLSE